MPEPIYPAWIRVPTRYRSAEVMKVLKVPSLRGGHELVCCNVAERPIAVQRHSPYGVDEAILRWAMYFAILEIHHVPYRSTKLLYATPQTIIEHGVKGHALGRTRYFLPYDKWKTSTYGPWYDHTIDPESMIDLNADHLAWLIREQTADRCIVCNQLPIERLSRSGYCVKCLLANIDKLTERLAIW